MQRHCYVGPACFQNVCASTFHSLQLPRGAELHRQCTKQASGVLGACISPQRAPSWAPVSHATLATRGLAIRPAATIVLSVCVAETCCLFLCCLALPREWEFLSGKFFG